MKINHIMLFLLTLFSSILLSSQIQLTPQNTAIVSDLDEVLIQKTFLLNAAFLVKSIVEHYSDDEDHNNVGGLVFHLLYSGMYQPCIASHIVWLFKMLEHSHTFIKGTEEIYRYLKDVKGYHIFYATNKDHLSYDLCAEILGNKFTYLPDKVFVAHPEKKDHEIEQLKAFANLPTTSESYRELLHRALTIQPTTIILHAPTKKPNLAYYRYVEKHVGPEKNIIFIDDQPKNVAGFDELQKTAAQQRIGIIFTDPQQLVQAFVDIGILSEINDAALLEDIRYPGIWGKIRLFFKKLYEKIVGTASQPTTISSES